MEPSTFDDFYTTLRRDQVQQLQAVDAAILATRHRPLHLERKNDTEATRKNKSFKKRNEDDRTTNKKYLVKRRHYFHRPGTTSHTARDHQQSRQYCWETRTAPAPYDIRRPGKTKPFGTTQWHKGEATASHAKKVHLGPTKQKWRFGQELMECTTDKSHGKAQREPASHLIPKVHTRRTMTSSSSTETAV